MACRIADTEAWNLLRKATDLLRLVKRLLRDTP